MDLKSLESSHTLRNTGFVFLTWLVSTVITFVITILLFRWMWTSFKDMAPSAFFLVASTGWLFLLFLAVFIGGFAWVRLLKTRSYEWPGSRYAPYLTAGSTMIPMFYVGALLGGYIGGAGLCLLAGLIAAFLVERARQNPDESEPMQPSNTKLSGSTEPVEPVNGKA